MEPSLPKGFWELHVSLGEGRQLGEYWGALGSIGVYWGSLTNLNLRGVQG